MWTDIHTRGDYGALLRELSNLGASLNADLPFVRAADAICIDARDLGGVTASLVTSDG